VILLYMFTEKFTCLDTNARTHARTQVQ